MELKQNSESLISLLIALLIVPHGIETKNVTS